MKLFTYVAVQVEAGMSFATFHDPEALYGFSLTLCDPDSALEIMVADQSCYYSDAISVDLYRHYFVARMPQGTIDACDGEDDYEIHFRVDDMKYHELTSALTHLLNGRGALRIF